MRFKWVKVDKIMKFLEEGIKQLPDDLDHLILDLSSNNFGRNVEGAKWLVEGMK